MVLLEKRYLTSGSTGRCGAGIRQQWGTEMNCLISRASARIFKRLNEELEEGDIEFRETGYMLTAYDEEKADMLTGAMHLQHKLGIPSKKANT